MMVIGRNLPLFTLQKATEKLDRLAKVFVRQLMELNMAAVVAILDVQWFWSSKGTFTNSPKCPLLFRWRA
jgi:hypothetical protein